MQLCFIYLAILFRATSSCAVSSFGIRIWADEGIEYGQLDDRFVEPEYRKMGIGKALFGELGRVAESTTVAVWTGKCLSGPRRASTSMKALGAFEMKEWEGMRLETEGVKGLRRSRVLEATQ
ncbi:hypothetical protein CALCODRAFT_519256 [Calocera cornea HHB12733]|uniref:N-acetyltransferase domain-containing protein n=1 Tax=Calocera cornea HHB12733 TaxID=1353952 RepID=A0A165EE06_9BASI|nr:hypothetical protein CALCODRAFT_519256 [Calocera cornea HHB12733]